MYFRKRGLNWSNSTAAQNRRGLRELAGKDPAPGLVGYQDGKAVAWVSLAPRDAYERLRSSKVLAPVDESPVWSIVCFVVSRDARGQGVASQMLEAAVDYARRKGATLLESYPVATERGRITSADAFHGTESMFKKQGFRVVARRQWSKTSPVRLIMRLEL
jgi:GNAT superfamily N-acetyltransferase